MLWNIGRCLEGKVAALERLIVDCERPEFIAILEIGHGRFEDSTVAGVLQRHRYRHFACRTTSRDPTHGGAALLVREDIDVEPWLWQQAADWNAECEAVSVRVLARGDRPAFVVSALYVRGSSTDTEGFARVINSAPDNQVLLTDANAQLPGSRPGAVIAADFKKRGEMLRDFIINRGAFYPAAAGPTRRKRITTAEGLAAYDPEDGTVNDHVVVGPAVVEFMASVDGESIPLYHIGGSDHAPLVWATELGAVAGAASNQNRQRYVAWHKVTDIHRAEFNRLFRKALVPAVAAHRLDMIAVEGAISRASHSALPHTKPRDTNANLFWDAQAAARVEQAKEEHGEAAQRAQAEAYRAARKATLAREAPVQPDSASTWHFASQYYGFKRRDGGRTRVATAGGTLTETHQERIETLAQSYASVHANPPEGPDSQADLAAAAATLATPASTQERAAAGNSVGVTELRACIAMFASGRCADRFGLRAEHLKLLDDESLAAMVPFIDRCVGRARLPDHWCEADVTPVLKKGRDATLCKSWRPVSVTMLLCRLCEHIVHGRIQHRIEQGNFRRGKSQFGFRRGVGTSMPLTGLSMFIRDGFAQRTTAPRWDAADEQQRYETQFGSRQAKQQKAHQHSTLIVSIDASDAYCRARPAVAVRRLQQMGLADEARWVAALLSHRTLVVKEGGVKSSPHALDRGVPQGSVLAPLLWLLTVDDLIAELEERCKRPLAGCIVVPIVFADDINFVLRGPNPSSSVRLANELLAIVRRWATTEGIPMSKLQATWIVGGEHAAWAENWTGERITYDEKVSCVPGVAPIRLLGVHYDSNFTFKAQVDHLVASTESPMHLLCGMAGIVKADKLAILYRGLILSRLLFAVDSWYPYASAADRQRIQSIHYEACRIITGCPATADAASVCYEAGFRMFEDIARDEIIKTADKMRRMSDGCADLRTPEHCFGPEWVVRLFRDGAMPTAELRPVTRADGGTRVRPAAVWPRPDFARMSQTPPDAPQTRLGLRDVGITLRHGAPHERGRNFDPRTNHPSLRPVPRIHPFAAQDLILFDTHVRFITDAPGGLTKLDKPMEDWTDEEKQPYAEANAARMRELERTGGAGSLYVFTDGSRTEDGGRRRAKEACAGAYVICQGQDPDAPGAWLHDGVAVVGPIACTYSAEIAAIREALAYVADNIDELRQQHALTDSNIVVVTDSKSSLESLRTTWLRRIQHMEQDVTQLLHRLVSSGVRVTLAFVFSHVGGAPGNAAADELAEAARKEHGKDWDGIPLWHVDTTRRIQRGHHRREDDRRVAERAFRFRTMPADLHGAPSERLPAEIPRAQERLLYQARIGMMVSAGGLLHAEPESCPLCREPGAIGRGGAAIEHLCECLPRYTWGPPLEIEPGDFWADPVGSSEQLAVASAIIAHTEDGRARAAAWAARRRRGAVQRPRQ